MVGNTGLLPSGDHFPGLVDSIPLHRLCEPEEVANAVTFYAKTGFTTGQSVILSGGEELKGRRPAWYPECFAGYHRSRPTSKLSKTQLTLPSFTF